jgi:hypothetical protein
MSKVDHMALDPVGAEIIREVARRILSDETGKITVGTEAARLTREGVPCPNDGRAQLYGRPLTGGQVDRICPESTLSLVRRLVSHARGTPGDRDRWPPGAYR